MSKYPEKQKYVIADSKTGKYAGMVLAMGNNDDQVEKALNDGYFPVDTKTYEDFFLDKIRHNGTDFYTYVKPTSEVLAEQLAAEKGKMLSTLQQNFNDVEYLFEKYVEGVITEDGYAPIKALKAKWREQYNAIQAATKIEELYKINVEKYVKASA